MMMAYRYRMTYFLRPSRLRMVGLLSGECVLPRVVITYFDVNVGYVFNQVFAKVNNTFL